MKFYDLHVNEGKSEGVSSISQFAERAVLLGYSGICVSKRFEGRAQLEKMKADAHKAGEKFGLIVLVGMSADSTKELKHLLDIRETFDVLIVEGGDLRLNRAAVETKEVDILAHPEKGRYDSGMNHVMAKLAKNNKVAIELNMNEIIDNNKKSRSRVIAHMIDNVKLAKKYKMPILICSGARSYWDMKDPLVLSSMAEQLGMNMKEAKNAISKSPESIMKRVEDRKSDGWVIPGVIKR